MLHIASQLFAATAALSMGPFIDRHTMSHFLSLANKHPIIFFHLVTALGALVIGIYLLALKPRGDATHKGWGWVWVALMLSTAVASAFIRDYRMINIAGFTPIHGFTVLTLYQLPKGINYIRTGDVQAHRKTMRGLFIGACVVAGIFTLMPGRFLGTLLWKHMLGVL
jgi:uncharacterized membrane protein